jgi:tetratricopeptide (TPR) repeat protein
MDDGAKQLVDAEEVIAIARTAGNPLQLGQGLYQRANALANLNRIDEASAAAAEVVAHVAPHEMWILAAAALNAVIPMHAAHWRFRESADAAALALACARKTGRSMEASTLTVRAVLSYLLGAFAEVDEQLERIVSLLDELGRFPEASSVKGFNEPDMRYTVHYLRGLRLRAAGESDEAAACVRSMARFDDLHVAPMQGNAYRFLAVDIACDLGEAELLAQAPAHLAAIRPTRRQSKFGFSGCAALSLAR